MISQEKLRILTPLRKLPKNLRDLGKLIVAKGLKKLPKVQKIAQSGHTDCRSVQFLSSTSGRSYKHVTFINYDSRVVITKNCLYLRLQSHNLCLLRLYKIGHRVYVCKSSPSSCLADVLTSWQRLTQKMGGRERVKHKSVLKETLKINFSVSLSSLSFSLSGSV